LEVLAHAKDHSVLKKECYERLYFSGGNSRQFLKNKTYARIYFLSKKMQGTNGIGNGMDADLDVSSDSAI
jgi:hypothetical protein